MKIQTDESFYSADEGFIRSSALKTWETCSWLYYAQYVLKIPTEDNEGSQQGNCCHSFFECILNQRRRPLYQKIIDAGTIRISKSSEKLIRKFMKKNNLPNTTEIFNKIDKMILVGLKTDFYVEGGTIVGKEYRFRIKNKSPKYAIYGTMDKLALKGDYIIIDDFKSSKLKYSGDDKTSSIQALIYSLACKRLWPNHKPKVRFIFLQYPDNPIQEVEFSDEILKGFEYFLESCQKKFDNFTEKDARINFAADKQIPTDGSWGGRLVCGFANKHGELKKDGKPKWKCMYKLPFDYFVLKKGDRIIKSSKIKENLIPSEGETIEIVHFDGCPKFRNAVDNIPTTKVSKYINTENILDDF